MRNDIRKIIIVVLVIAIIGIFVYLWFLVALWAIAFIATILAVALIVYGLFRLKKWLNKKKDNHRQLEERHQERGYIKRENRI